MDREAASGNFYYRLKQVDDDGTVAFSSIISMALKQKEKLFTIGPNPASERLDVFLGDNAENITLSIISSNGLTLSGKQVSKSSKASFDLTGYLPGTYLLKINRGQAMQTHRFVISK